MTNEEMERSVDFILKQQAQFAADMQKAGERQTRTEENLGTVVELVGQIAQTQLQMAEAQAQMTEAQAQMTEAQKHTDQGLAETDRRLNSLILMVERYLSNGRGNN
jgi:uncharacterized phage infection (PIP) family protein YhgE